jgi:hypothetical protein
MRLSVLLALAWIACAGTGLAARTGIAGGTSVTDSTGLANSTSVTDSTGVAGGTSVTDSTGLADSTSLAGATGLVARAGFAADVPFKVLSAGKVTGQVEAGLTEVRDAKALAQVWSRLGLKGRAPKVNFKQRMVVAWVGGGSACDKYVLTRVHEDESNVVLEINRVRPPTGHMCIMIFSPSAIVASMPQTNKPAQAGVSDPGMAAGESTR